MREPTAEVAVDLDFVQVAPHLGGVLRGGMDTLAPGWDGDCMSATTTAATAAAAGTFQVDNPATGEIVGHVPDMTNDVPSLVQRARIAQREWGARPIRERAEVLGAMRRWLVRNRDRVVESSMRETGKTYEDALLNEVFVVADILRFWEKRSLLGRFAELGPAAGSGTLGN
jgi:acyl-CoA reductase-like NAD-dependent aldehyde dehydrogenase